jgi:hypothetical protein
MKWTPWLLGCTTAALLAGCHHNNETGAASVAPKDTTGADTSRVRTASDSGYRTNDTTTMKAKVSDSTKSDTSSMNRDTSSTSRNPSSAGAAPSDSMSMPRDTSSMKRDSTGANGTASADSTSNQTKSGVTDTKTGKSTLGKGVTKTSPDQGQPVTAKGDTLSRGDSTSSTSRDSTSSTNR